MGEGAALNTDRELYRGGGGDGNGQSHYEPSVHVTEHGAIGINVGGHVITTSIRGWHEMATQRDELLTHAAKVTEVRDFAADLIAYEAEHAAGDDTPHRLAIARDLLTIVGCPTCSGPSRETVGMVCQTCGTDYSGPSYCDRGPCVKLLGHDGNCTIGDDCDDCGGTGYTVQGRTWKNGYREDQYGSCLTCSPIRRMCVGCGTPLDEHPDGPPCSPPPPPGRPHG